MSGRMDTNGGQEVCRVYTGQSSFLAAGMDVKRNALLRLPAAGAVGLSRSSLRRQKCL